MTDIRQGGAIREALVADLGVVRLGGLAREALIAGIGLSGTISSKAFADAALSVLLSAALSGTIEAQSAGRGRGAILGYALAGHISGNSRARAQLPISLSLAGRARTAAAAHLAPLHLTVIGGRAASSSGAQVAAIIATVAPGQNAVTLNVG
jgi:hypothetical protein